ncbi:hypothetical protein D9757_005260 [Collybiopsis confluens]|uniref:Uncharacterized protein n=1 Tax=Collybiopsis confluens TaxID=2823264 RepID=A0A8H5HWI6_9AGAR|nr:hypothetical protein D9757_005260 [Collybiopsis confluens]
MYTIPRSLPQEMVDDFQLPFKHNETSGQARIYESRVDEKCSALLNYLYPPSLGFRVGPQASYNEEIDVTDEYSTRVDSGDASWLADPHQLHIDETSSIPMDSTPPKRSKQWLPHAVPREFQLTPNFLMGDSAGDTSWLVNPISLDVAAFPESPAPSGTSEEWLGQDVPPGYQLEHLPPNFVAAKQAVPDHIANAGMDVFGRVVDTTPGRLVIKKPDFVVRKGERILLVVEDKMCKKEAAVRQLKGYMKDLRSSNMDAIGMESGNSSNIIPVGNNLADGKLNWYLYDNLIPEASQRFYRIGDRRQADVQPMEHISRI